jgi:shikimate kinase
VNRPASYDRPYFNLILVGTTGGRLMQTGKLVAERQNARFIVLETEIRTREGYSVDDIRGLFGIARLRRVESDLCRELALQRGAVIGVPCNTLLDDENRTRLAESGAILALTCSLNETLRRMYIAQGAYFQDPATRDLTLDSIRRDLQALRLTASPALDTTRLTVEQCADYALAYWREHGAENSPARLTQARSSKTNSSNS